MDMRAPLAENMRPRLDATENDRGLHLLLLAPAFSKLLPSQPTLAAIEHRSNTHATLPILVPNQTVGNNVASGQTKSERPKTSGSKTLRQIADNGENMGNESNTI